MIKLKNNTGTQQTYCGQVLEDQEEYSIAEIDLQKFATNDLVLCHATNLTLKVYDNNNVLCTTGSDAVNTLKELLPIQTVTSSYTLKTFGTKKLYKRVTGIQQALIQGETTFEFAITYPWVKLIGLQIMGGETLDKANLYILDDANGTYSTIPNYTLNQFGFSVNIAKDFYKNESQFDADLYVGMRIKVVYTSVSAKTVGVNIIMDEVKT